MYCSALKIHQSKRNASDRIEFLFPAQVELVTTKDTDISSFLTSSLAFPEQALLLRLNYSEDSPRLKGIIKRCKFLIEICRCEQLTTEEWKRQVVEGTWGLYTPKPSLGHKVLFFSNWFSHQTPLSAGLPPYPGLQAALA